MDNCYTTRDLAIAAMSPPGTGGVYHEGLCWKIWTPGDDNPDDELDGGSP